jgi:hypothetical protein
MVNNPKARANLRPVKNSIEAKERGRLGGRPKGKSLATILKETLNSSMPMGVNPVTKEAIASGRITVKDAFILSQIAHAMKGNSPIAKEIWERIDGKIAQTVQGVDEDGSISIKVKFE